MEIWKSIPWLSTYEASSCGRVRNAKRKNILRPRIEKSGHLQVDVEGMKRRVHILVLLAFVGPCPADMEARHLNGRPADNRWPQNLEWSTKAVNGADRLKHNPRANWISLNLARRVKAATKKHTYRGAPRDIARRYGVSISVVRNIKYGVTHKHL